MFRYQPQLVEAEVSVLTGQDRAMARRSCSPKRLIRWVKHWLRRCSGKTSAKNVSPAFWLGRRSRARAGSPNASRKGQGCFLPESNSAGQ